VQALVTPAHKNRLALGSMAGVQGRAVLFAAEQRFFEGQKTQQQQQQQQLS
jgi:hypothetical protein